MSEAAVVGLHSAASRPFSTSEYPSWGASANHAAGSDSLRSHNPPADTEANDNETVPWLSRMGAAALLVLVSPLIAGLVVLVRLESRGRGIYSQERVGLHGRRFTLYKIRSMRSDAESGTGAVWARRGDPRVTWLGRFLRWSHLDELPQLMNVVRGEMNFVGPRPERPEFVERLAREVPRYRERLDMHPGITGLAQVCLPPDDPQAGLQTVADKLSLELAYMQVQRQEAWLDLRILLATFLKMVGVPQPRNAALLQLTRIPAVPIAIPTAEPQRRAA